MSTLSPLPSPVRSLSALPTPASTPSPSAPIKFISRVESFKKPGGNGPRSLSLSASRSVSSSGSTSSGKSKSFEEVEEVGGGEWGRCSREVLSEMVGRLQRELETAREKGHEVDLDVGELRREVMHLSREGEVARLRIEGLMNDQGRMEEELAGRIEVLDKLRSSVRELERAKRDAEKRYREQTESFESERTSWYDQEQHYKLRIANLSTPRKPRIPDTPKPLKDGELDGYHTPRLLSPSPSRSACSSPVPGETTSTEAALQDQLASLTVAHTSLTATGRALQIELSELKRVYHDLQEENESYEVLLGEKTMNGEMGDLFRKSLDHGSGGRGLESVGEGQETDEEEEDEIERVVRSNGRGSRGPSTPKTRRKSSVAGSGLDLAAELEAAMSDDHESEEETKKPTHKRNASIGDVDLRIEIKHLREANKALTLYVSKIVDRVCSQEGFDKVLAVEFKPVVTSDSLSDTPRARPSTSFFRAPTAATSTSSALNREASVLSSPPPVVPKPDRSRKTLSLGWDSVSSAFASALSRAGPISPPPVPPSGFKPFMLNANSDLARKLEMEEDAEDAKERERLRAEMALIGISKENRDSKRNSGEVKGGRGGGMLELPSKSGAGLLSSPILDGHGSSGGHGGRTLSHGSSNAPFRRSPLLSSPSQSDQENDLPPPPPSLPIPLVAINLQSLDTKEKEAKSEMEKGRASGFTEQKPRRARPVSTQSARSIGLGIGSAEVSPRSSPMLGGGGFQEGEEDASWSKKIKRMSLGWSSPAVV